MLTQYSHISCFSECKVSKQLLMQKCEAEHVFRKVNMSKVNAPEQTVTSTGTSGWRK